MANSLIASVGADVPVELLAATGRYAGPLGWNIDRDFPRASQWLESKYAPWAFSILEDWAAGAFDHLDAVVFSRADDNAQRLYYYLCELRRRGLVAGPEPLILDIARIARSSSEERCIAALLALAKRLGVDDAALEQAIVAANVRRRSAAVPPPSSAPTCLLAGSAPPDRRVHAMIEAAGWQPAGEVLGEIWARLGDAVDEATGDPFAALGRRLHGERFGSRGFYDRNEALLAQVRDCGAGAVVLWYIEEDEAEVWHLPTRRRALEAAGIPALVLTRADWRARDGIDARIATFLNGVAA